MDTRLVGWLLLLIGGGILAWQVVMQPPLALPDIATGLGVLLMVAGIVLLFLTVYGPARFPL